VEAEDRSLTGSAVSTSGRTEAKQAEAAWEGAGLDPYAWEKTIRPALAWVGLSAIIGRLGVWKSSAWGWKVGRTTPHPSHCRPLVEVAGITLDSR
jgi:hypothetical protein